MDSFSRNINTRQLIWCILKKQSIYWYLYLLIKIIVAVLSCSYFVLIVTVLEYISNKVLVFSNSCYMVYALNTHFIF